MKLDFKKLTIKKQLVILFCLFVVLAIVNFIVIRQQMSEVETSEEMVEISQTLPQNLEKIKKELEQVSASDEDSKKQLYRTAKSFDEIVDLFLNGGKLPNGDIYIDPVSDQKKQNLNYLNVLWDSVFTNINIIRFEPHLIDTIVQDVEQVPNYDSLNTYRTEVVSRMESIDNPSVVMAKAFVSENIDELKSRVTSFSDGLVSSKKLAEEIFDYIIVISVFLNLIILSLLLLGIRKLILEQLNKLDNITTQLSQGHFDVQADFEWKNEINDIAIKINALAAHLKNATDFVKEVGKGELEVKFKGIDHDHVNENSLEGALISMRDQMKKVEEEEKIRKWTSNGLTKFVDILRSSNDNVSELCDKIISNLVDYTNSNQGGLYLLNDDNGDEKKLDLVSLYAFDTKKYDQKSYRLGEGLVGQTFLERKTTYLLEIPNDYIFIKSGLGGANPKAILIVPLQVNEDIFGILELASFNKYKDYEIEFVEKLGESIASTIATVRNNQRTKRLLEESQELTEQMQAQEEEMRQNMEELSATQEEMARKEVEITAQLTAINNSIGTVEYDDRAIITNANDIFLSKMGYSSEELLDSSFGAIYAGNKAIIQAVKAGDQVNEDLDFKKENGEVITLECSFTPIKNDKGELYKIIQLVTSFGKQNKIQQTADHWKEAEQIEEALRQNLEELQITQEQLDAKIKYTEEQLGLISQNLKSVSLNHDYKIINCNNSSAEFFGFSKSELKGKAVDVLIEGVVQALKDSKNIAEGVFKTAANEKINQSINIIYPDNSDKSETFAIILWV